MTLKRTVQSVMEELVRPVAPLERTVDQLLFGDPLAEVTGIMVVFMPTQRVIEEAVEVGANLIIAHEGPFFSHQDQTGSARTDAVYETKKRTIEEAGLAVFRFHDYIHRYKPDWITAGLVQALGWEAYVTKHRPEAAIVALPPAPLDALAAEIKERLGLPYVRIIGDAGQSCTRAGLLVGYRGGGGNAIPLFEEEALDLVVCGEGPEWETPEYVRDAVRQGGRKALIVIGHAESEVPGMRLLAERLQTRYPELPIHFRNEQPVFRLG